ncbi:uncharacterized protein LOC144886144 [Branchiostoma floridae x Branchiostoma japonicum]
MLSSKEAQKIVDQVDLPDDPHTQISRLSKTERQALIQQKTSDEALWAAALEIQRVWRGHFVRCKYFALTHPDESKQCEYQGSRFQHSEQGLRDVRTPPQEIVVPKRDKSLQRMKLETAYKNYVEEMVRQGRNLDRAEIFSFNDFCASEIQKAWRRSNKGRVISKPLSAMSSGMSFLKDEGKTEPISERKAAMKIQRAWRRHIDVQVYRYYRDLINFKGKGDPSMMLRCINPNESKLLDSAMGAHVKFRLAGERFPPNIYYKIFTHRTIIDLCANSPKDYTKAAILRVEAKQRHNRTIHKPIVDDKAGWYERIENNGWRLVSDRLLQNAQQDMITWESSRKKVDFHHNKLRRKQDVEKKRKKKKVEWMMKMYKEGMLRSKSTDSHTSTLIQDAANGIVRVAQEKGPDSIQDWEVDELLDWTNGLNFDEYMDTWKEIGTSAASERQINIISADPAAFALSSVAHLIDTPKGSRVSGAQSKHQSPHPGAMDSHPPSRPTPGTPEPEAY